MQFTPCESITEERISLIEGMSADEVLTKVTGREEVSLRPHCHNRHQIIYVLSGTLHVETEKTSYFVTDRHLVWIPSGTQHRLSSNNRQITLLTSYFLLANQSAEEVAVYHTDELIARNLRFISTFPHLHKLQQPEIFSFAKSFSKCCPASVSKPHFPCNPLFWQKTVGCSPYWNTSKPICIRN